jgi:hypothetical protein
MDSADFLQILGAGLSFLPYYFPEDKVAAWETASKQKLLALSNAAAAHAGKVLVAVGAVIAASIAYIEHHASAFFRVVAITGEQHPHEAVSFLATISWLVMVAGVIFLAYLAVVLLVHFVCRVIANNKKGVFAGCGMALDFVLLIIRKSS